MKKIFVLIMVFAIIMSLVACDLETVASPTDIAKTEQKNQAENQSNLHQRQPPPKLEWSLERDNLIKRLERWNDPNKISYIYLISDTGTIMAFFPIKGKVSSVNSSLTGAEQIVHDPNMEGCGEGRVSASLLMESPDYDGSYGTNGDAVFFFLTDGTYMEWSGKYLLCDQPVKLAQQPIMMYEVKK
jgi:hypothetical protein